MYGYFFAWRERTVLVCCESNLEKFQELLCETYTQLLIMPVGKEYAFDTLEKSYVDFVARRALRDNTSFDVAAHRMQQESKSALHKLIKEGGL